MKILFLGYSRFVRKRALNAAIKCGLFTHIAVASKSASANQRGELLGVAEVFNDYAQAIHDYRPDIVYVSLVNSDHARWAEQAIKSGAHVVVDKPAFLSPAEAIRLVDLAEASKRCIAEATVYAFHPQIEAVKKIFSDTGSHISRVSAFFSFPPLSAEDYRYQKSLGGGALLDQGPYAVSMCRIFMGEPPIEMIGRINNWFEDAGKKRVEISFSVLATFSGGRCFTGHFGFDTEYKNCISLLGPGLSIDIDRVSTIEPDLENTLYIREKNLMRTIKLPASDNVCEFFHHLVDAIQHNKVESFYNALLQDAENLNRLIISAMDAAK